MGYGLLTQPRDLDALYQAILDKKTQVREPGYAQKAASRDNEDIGYSYVEVSSERRLVLYKSGMLLWIPIRQTPDGVYSIEEKNRCICWNRCRLSFTDDLDFMAIWIKSQCHSTRGHKLRQYGLWWISAHNDRLDRHKRPYCTAARGCTGTVSQYVNGHAGWLFINSEIDNYK